ncbi:hypothetical protein Theam_0015 [Thermovibrio ammonificans HB-1]|uniref:Tip attachment protein J domain-containing protein n=1 Tax=Thermovibrio ammonificans (strain DSM 15698 / JCM 12110 / HB-1) TaxID=648996 RepID=E8T2R4_THEA1|nr:phage tail protein [Thermovibrio ammonificans]ADU95989.1 hypothetical protein Theam_0015 [Thermovibrio ammonificans HB-1]
MKLLDRVISPNEKGKTLADVLREHGLRPESQNIQIWIDGKLSKVPPDKLKVRPGWKIEIVPLPTGGGGGVLGAIGAIAVGVLTGGLAAAAIGSITLGAFTLSASTVFSLGFMVGAGIFSYLTAPKPKVPSFGDIGDMFGSSPTYSWNGVQTAMTQGVPVPVVYGRHAVGGVRLQYRLFGTDCVTGKVEDGELKIGRTENNGTPVGRFAQWLWDFVLLSEGEIEELEELWLNDVFYKSIEGKYFHCVYTKGKSSPEPITLFSGNLAQTPSGKNWWWGEIGYGYFQAPTYITVPINKTVSSDEKFVYITKLPSKMIEKISINLHFPNGLFKITDSGGLTLEECKLKFTLYKGYEKLGESPEIPIYGGVKEPFIYVYDIYINKGFQKENQAPYPFGYNFYDPQDNLTLEEIPYTLIIEKVSADNPTIKDSNTLSIQCITEELGKGAGVSPPSDSGLSDITENPFKVSYSGSSILVYSIAASSVISGNLPNIRAVMKGKKVKLYNFETGQWEIAWSDNPAWIIRDILTNPRYGLGDFITDENIDDESFIAFAQFCQEQGYRCNLVLDGFQRGWDLINNLLAKFRAFILRNGSKYKVKFLKDEPPVQMFTMGNIVQGSLKVHFISLSDRYNTIEARFLDETDGYKMKTILVSTGDKYERKKTIDFFGITDKFLLNWMQKVKRSIEFDVYLDALAIEPGDIFLFSHDVPKWLTSGRIVRQEGNILILDRTVAPESNYIKVRTKDDQILTFEIENVEETKIYLKTSTPELENCPYICGKISETPKLYRCTEITRTAENIRHIVAVEHIPELFD